MRFSVVQVKDGPWLVVDGADHRRLIASCADAETAQMVMALMNGDFEQAVAGREAAQRSAAGARSD
jgi:hypothetical protein